MKKIHALPAFFIALFLLHACVNNPEKKIRFFGEAQGTYYAVTYFSRDTVISQPEIDSILTAFDQSASVWVSGSIISKINHNEEVKPDQYFIDIFNQAKRIWLETNGAFDITVGPLVNAWGFGFKNKIPVTDQAVDSLLQLVNFDGLELKNGQIIKENPNIQMDFNAIAQGYSVDVLSGFFQSRGIENYLIDIGGEVYAKGNKPGGEMWVVGIEKPADNAGAERKIERTIKIKNEAIATSGSYRKYYEKDGKKYSHTIDPTTGFPVEHALLSATVISDSTSIADAYATALMVMGVEKSKEFLKQSTGIEAYLIYAGENGEYETWATEKMSARLKND